MCVRPTVVGGPLVLLLSILLVLFFRCHGTLVEVSHVRGIQPQAVVDVSVVWKQLHNPNTIAIDPECPSPQCRLYPSWLLLLYPWLGNQAYRGDVIKFSGDALSILFEADGTVQQSRTAQNQSLLLLVDNRIYKHICMYTY